MPNSRLVPSGKSWIEGQYLKMAVQIIIDLKRHLVYLYFLLLDISLNYMIFFIVSNGQIFHNKLWSKTNEIN